MSRYGRSRSAGTGRSSAGVTWMLRRASWIAVAAVVIVTAGVSVAYAMGHDSGAMAARAINEAASPTSSVDTTGFPSGPGDPGIFTDRCALSHTAADDPIMQPGKTGQSMLHNFFGNTATSATSTAARLVGGATTCSTRADASAYWTPVLYQDGKPLVPVSSLIYWKQAHASTASVHTVPIGLQMIAGDETASSPQPVSVIAWSCQRGDTQGSSGAMGRKTDVPHHCDPGSRLKLTVTFPDCWNGRTLAGATQTNVAYPAARGACPASHPIEIPQIVFHVVYPTASASELTLSMGPHMQGSVDTAHADFINGWNEHDLTADVTACIATATRCGEVIGANAAPKGPNKRELARLARQKHRSARQHH